LEGLRKLKEPCELQFFTDSEYLRNGITIWCKAWKRKNWKKGLRPVRNVDLWQALDMEAGKHVVAWNWVRGHSGNPENERCDVLAVAEIAKLKKAHSKEEIAAALKDFVKERDRKPWLEGNGEAATTLL
jgi:ribonuclease HI